MKTILITGAAGFIGFHTARRLCLDGHEVVGIDNLNDYYDVTLKRARLKELECLPGFRFEKMDIVVGGGHHDVLAFAGEPDKTMGFSAVNTAIPGAPQPERHLVIAILVQPFD